MNTASWISSQVSRLLPPSARKRASRGLPNVGAPIADNIKPVEAGLGSLAVAASEAESRGSGAKGLVPVRSTQDRLKGRVRHTAEALSPRELRQRLNELRAVIDPHVSEVEGGRRALALAQWYRAADLPQRVDLWLLMSEQFVANPRVLKEAQAGLARAAGTPDEAAAEVTYRRATVSPRRRLLQRFSAYSGGIRFLVDMRAELLPFLKQDKRLRALDAEMEYMFSTWFDVGFLGLRRISWDSPASLIEKLIKYEAVHDITSWADVKNRLDSDRRCYGFFHPNLPEEPLIFVEVAMADSLPATITPLLDESAEAANLDKATVACFYSISNTQSGLRGVSFGDSLIKRVVESLKLEFPKLTVFATLSPIPGFRAWLDKNAEAMVAKLDAKALLQLNRQLGADTSAPSNKAQTAQRLLTAADDVLGLAVNDPVRQLLLRCAAHYLTAQTADGKPMDPVARFHLGNGARVERLNWAGDPSAKGLRQSCGVMVNYMYDLHRLDAHRAGLEKGKIAVSSAVQRLRFPG